MSQDQTHKNRTLWLVGTPSFSRLLIVWLWLSFIYASYNGVRSDSVQFSFPAACRDQDHLYHGPQVNNQVPPL